MNILKRLKETPEQTDARQNSIPKKEKGVWQKINDAIKDADHAAEGKEKKGKIGGA